MRRSSSPSTGELLGWATAGLGLGVIAGVALGHWLGVLSRPRLAEAVRRRGGAAGPPAGGSSVIRAAQAALLADAALAELDLETVARGRDTIELRGWVPSRRLRARAARVVADALPEGLGLVNRLLVRGEDDDAPDRSPPEASPRLA